MSDYIILTDSSADIPQEYLADGKIFIIPMTMLLNGEEMTHVNPADWDSKGFYAKLRDGGSCSTTQITPALYHDYFEPWLKKGKDILYLSLSGGLSATWQSASLAASELLEDYPDRKISCVDSRAATGGQGILTIYALENQEKGMTLEENTKWLEDNRLNICHWFTVDDLDFLKRGGRISPTIAWIGGKLKIKPILIIANDGSLSIMEKVRGSKVALNFIAKKNSVSSFDPEHPYVFLCHGDAEEQAEHLKEMVLAAHPEAKVIIMPMSPIIGGHTGPGVQSVIYFGNNRN